MRANQATYPVRVLYRLLGLSPSGFYAWRRRGPSSRAVTNQRLLADIRTIHTASREAYGAPMIHAELVETGWAVNHKRVARLMRSAGIVGVTRRKWHGTTRRDPTRAAAPDLVERAFRADRPNQLWVAEITYIPTWTGFLYLAIVLEVCSRRIDGWAMAPTLQTTLVLDALNMAMGSASLRRSFTTPIRAVSTPRSPSAVGARSWVSAPPWARSVTATTTRWPRVFFATLECELLNRRRFRTQADARMGVFDWIEGWYNPRRRHSSLGRVSPLNYERRLAAGSRRSTDWRLSPGKPPRIHWRTYARHLEALEAVERARDAEWMIDAARLVGHIDATAARRLRRVRPAGLTT